MKFPIIFLIFLTLPFLAAAEPPNIMLHPVEVSEIEFQNTLHSWKGTSFIDYIRTQSAQDFEQVEVNPVPQDLLKTLDVIEGRPILKQDLEIWWQAFRLLPEKFKSPTRKKLAQSFSSSPLDNLSANKAFVTGIIPNQCMATVLIDGYFLSPAEAEIFLQSSAKNAIHQWSYLSNCSIAKTLIGNISDFSRAIREVRILQEADDNEIMLWNKSFRLVKALDLSVAEINPSRSAVKKPSSFWSYAIPIGLGLVGLTAYELRDKEVSVKWPSFSFK